MKCSRAAWTFDVILFFEVTPNTIVSGITEKVPRFFYDAYLKTYGTNNQINYKNLKLEKMKSVITFFASLFLFGWGFAQVNTPAGTMPAGSFETQLVEITHQQAGIGTRNGTDISGDFTDPTFNAVVRNLIGIPTGAFTAEDAAVITDLTAIFMYPPIMSLNGIEHLVNLEVLNIPENRVEEVDFSNNLKLRTIGMAQNNLALNGIDVSMLYYLEDLDISQNRALDEAFWTWTLLDGLDLTNNPRLINLNAASNGLESLDLSGNPLLEIAIISENRFTTLDFTHNPNLRVLLMASGWNVAAGAAMQLGELDLTNLSRLEVLTVTGNAYLHTINMPADLGEFLNFTADDVPMLASIDISNAPKFQAIVAINSGLTSVTLSNNPSLYIVNLAGSPISSINITGSDNIVLLDVFMASLNSIDVSSLTYLEILNIGNDYFFGSVLGNNNFTELDVSNNSNLEVLNIGGNSISVLDVTNNPALTLLNARGNNLTELDLSQNIALYILWAVGNNLTQLDITNTQIGFQFPMFGAGLALEYNNFADVMDVYGWWYRPNLNPGEGDGDFFEITGINFTFWPQQNLPPPTGPPVITTASLPAAIIGEPFDVMMQSTGRMHQIWTVIWPPENPQNVGLILEQNGRLHGTALPGTEGTWNFQVIATGPWGDESDIKDLVLVIKPALGVGIETINLADAVQIFPNPVRNELNIAADSGLAIIGASIFNTSGQMIQSVANPGHQIDVSSLPSGIYFIRIETDQGTVTKHFVKE